MVVAVSDSHFKYEKVAFGSGNETRVLSNPHAPQGDEPETENGTRWSASIESKIAENRRGPDEHRQRKLGDDGKADLLGRKQIDPDIAEREHEYGGEARYEEERVEGGQ